MVHRANQSGSPKGWFVGPWDSPVPTLVGYANQGISELHYHAEMFEVCMAARGTSVAIINDVEVGLKTGYMLVIEPGEIHTFAESPADHLHFVIQAPFVKGDKVVL